MRQAFLLGLVLASATEAVLNRHPHVRRAREATFPDYFAPSNSVHTPEPQTWPHEESDIAPDPDIHVGKLDNGMRYMVLPHAEPPGRLSLRMHVDAGSLNEEEDQRGLAHFLEHMVFNGSRNFAPGELIPIMQRLGIAFGSHANAYTSYDETVYMLDLPNTDEETLDLAFTVMRDYADGALLDEGEIEKERGVILSEMTAGDSVMSRISERQFEFLLGADHLIARRAPIGTTEVITTATRERFVDFYERCYVPGRITFVASGDMGADDLEARIKGAFSSMGMADPDRPCVEPEMGELPTGNGFRTAVFTDEELGGEVLSLDFVRPYRREPDTVQARMERLPLELANLILNRRFDILARQEDTPINAGSMERLQIANAVEVGYVAVSPVPGGWQDSVSVLEQELRRVVEHGFTESEVESAVADTLSSYQRAAERAESRKAKDLARGLSDTVNSRRVFSTPEENFRIAKMGLVSVTPEVVHEAFVEHWDTADLNLLLVAKRAHKNATDMLAALYSASQEIDVEPPKDGVTEVVTFAYEDFGPAGTVVNRTRQEDLDITHMVLSNKVRVNTKRTDFEENQVRIIARFGTGKLGQPRNATFLDTFAQTVINAGGLGNHSRYELSRALSGRHVELSFFVLNDAFVFSGRTTPQDLELQLQVMAAFLSDPGYREEGTRQFRRSIPQVFTELRHTLDGAQYRMEAWLMGGDGRFAMPQEEDLYAFEAADVRSWIHPQLVGDYLEVSIVGDFDPDAAMAPILATLGALPERADSPDIPDPSSREVAFPEAPSNRTFYYESKIAQAASVAVWSIPPIVPTSQEGDMGIARRMNVLASIMKNRMRTKIREDLGLTYSPSARATSSDAFDYGTLVASSVGDPDDAAEVATILVDIGTALAVDGATEDELDRALEPMLNGIEAKRRSNMYWALDVMAKCQADPRRLDWARSMGNDYASITGGGINALAAEYLGAENAIRVELLPRSGDDGEAQEGAATETSTLGGASWHGSLPSLNLPMGGDGLV